jgi:hypothetical protein
MPNGGFYHRQRGVDRSRKAGFDVMGGAYLLTLASTLLFGFSGAGSTYQ